MPSQDVLTLDELAEEFQILGLSAGSVAMVHSSISSFGTIEGGASTVYGALQRCVGPSGTLVVPTFTGEVSDPFPSVAPGENSEIDARRAQVPIFRDDMPTSMGSLANTLLADPLRVRSRHPQASVAAVGARADEIVRHQPLAFAVGMGSPFAAMHRLSALIVLLGVGHNRNSFLHYAESLASPHRTKLRRFPYLVEGERVWIETPDVGDDNGVYFPRIGEEFQAVGGTTDRTIGSARCQLMSSVPLVDFATRRLADLVQGGMSSPG